MLDEVKEYLNISYDDPATDKNLASALVRGKEIINGYAGKEQDYEKEGLPKQLLLDYCRYVRSHAAEMFEINYRHDLIALRDMVEVQEYAKKQKSDNVSDL